MSLFKQIQKLTESVDQEGRLMKFGMIVPIEMAGGGTASWDDVGDTQIFIDQELFYHQIVELYHQYVTQDLEHEYSGAMTYDEIQNEEDFDKFTDAWWIYDKF